MWPQTIQAPGHRALAMGRTLGNVYSGAEVATLSDLTDHQWSEDHWLATSTLEHVSILVLNQPNWKKSLFWKLPDSSVFFVKAVFHFLSTYFPIES